MIKLSPAAAEQIRHAASASGAGEMHLRIAAHYDEVSRELHYGIGFDDEREEDETFDVAGITLLVSPLSIDAVDELTIDFVEIEPGDFRFIFYRPDELAAGAG